MTPQGKARTEKGDSPSAKNAEVQSPFSVLAWCGWRLRMPRDWRPLRLEGEARSGSAMIGDAVEARLKVSWVRVAKARAKRCWSRRLRRRAERVEQPPPRGFTDCVLLRPAKGRQLIWVGCAEGSGLVVELIYRRPEGPGRQDQVDRVVLPSLQAAPPGGDGTLWSIFGASFVAPRGFALVGRSLHLGEISLRFARGREVLSLGQVYPADLALSRRPLGFWLRSWPWEQKALRRFRQLGEDRPWRVERGGCELVGLLRAGRKAVRWPLGFLAPRRVLSAAAVDVAAGRILRGELQSPGEPAESVLARAVGDMNRADEEAGPC